MKRNAQAELIEISEEKEQISKLKKEMNLPIRDFG